MGIKVIDTIDGSYYIAIGELRTDGGIADYLDISLRKYRNTLVNDYKAFRSTDKASKGEIYFKNEKDAENAIQEFITPLAVASKLNKAGKAN